MDFHLMKNIQYYVIFEDEVVDRLETLEDIFAGTVKTQGRLELYLFTKNPEKSEELCKEAYWRNSNKRTVRYRLQREERYYNLYQL